MKDFISENEKILDEWKISNEKYGEYNFAYDGIMNKGEVFIGEGYIERESDKNHIENQLWETTSLRVLFLTKDKNTWGGDLGMSEQNMGAVIWNRIPSNLPSIEI